MKVIKKGNKNEVMCPFCNSLLEPTENDIRGGWGNWPHMIVCPVCDQTIHLQPEKLRSIREHSKTNDYYIYV